MKKIAYLLCLASTVVHAYGQPKRTAESIITPWGEQIEQNRPEIPLNEYPRPQMKRDVWTNLNGIWNYAITPKGAPVPSSFNGEILVPFAPESRLSGVQKGITENDELWYSRDVRIPEYKKGERILLHFGAVDWRTVVYVNGREAGKHEGGYTPFSFDITPYLNNDGSPDNIRVRVWDPTDKGYQPIGKQKMNQEGIWYTPVSGIWQTVWLEPVSQKHVCEVKSVSDIDRSVLNVTVTPSCTEDATVRIALLDTLGNTVATAAGTAGETIAIPVSDPVLWSPENPYLYDMKVELYAGKKKTDEVKCYTAFRKISMEKDGDGIYRMKLNNKFLFHLGTLDQGWWPDGLYTAPTDEALRFDIEKTKDWGFNMIRKHVKVEPARWYYHCDKLGMLVWQDMPSGAIHFDGRADWKPQEKEGGRDARREAQSVDNYYAEWQAIMDMLYSTPSVVVWVPFNEAWGQFDTEKVAAWTKRYDPTRLVNSASGGNHRNCGDILDLHAYPAPSMFLNDPEKVNVMGEYGGIGFPIKGHLWKDRDNWGYISFKNGEEVTQEYIKYARMLIELVKKGFSGSVYTQTTDVEGEVNGIMTYDRKIVKMNEPMIREINRKIIESMNR